MKAKTGNSLTSRLLLGCCVIVLGCGTTSRIGSSEDLKARASEYKVSGRSGIMVKQKLQFGPYTTTHVKRSWVKGPAGSYGYSTGTPGQEDWVNIISADYIRRRQTFNFGMSDGRHQAEAYCVARFNADGLQIGPHKNSILNRGLDVWSWINNQSLYYVQIFTGKEEKPWELVLDNRKAQGNARTYTGVLAKNETEFYTIKPVNRLEQNGKVGTMPFGSVGFEISNAGGKTLAAVSLMEKGMVFLGDATEEEKLLLATLCTALLLQEQIG